MTIPYFLNHPIIKQFVGLKKYFRSHETKTSRQRYEDFRKFSETVCENGEDLAFDLMGSVNFGQAKEHSDTDVVIYFRCEHEPGRDCTPENCPKLNIYHKLLLNTLVYEYNKETYPIQIVDCINLNQLDDDLNKRNKDSLSLVKFGFYRSVCRGVNRKLLRKYEIRLNRDVELRNAVEESLNDCFKGLIHSTQHSFSFKKYMERVEEEGVKIPKTMAEKIQDYLNQ